MPSLKQLSYEMVSAKVKWEVFFKDAGIPSRQALEYATTFSDNRMRLDMLNELSRDLLRDLGIKAVGDVIAILRHGKQKLAEMKRSPSPEVIEEAIAGPSRTRSTHSTSRADNRAKRSPTPEVVDLVEVNKVIANPSAPIKITTSQKVNPAKHHTVINNAKPAERVKDGAAVTAALKSSSEATKFKAGKLSLSRRFDELAGDAKRQKLATNQDNNEVELEMIQSHKVQPSKGPPQSKAKPKGTMFTIQVPNVKPPNIPIPESSKPPQKVTVVPAQGKALNRTQHPTSIFDRLDASSSSSTAASLLKKNEIFDKNKTVFNRLGTKGEKTLDTAQKVQVVTGIVRAESPSQLVENKNASKSVFKRLGGSWGRER